jgi:hypothetical protein
VDAESKQITVFIVHAIKQLTYGFKRLDDVAESAADGSAMKAFYLNAIYNHVAAFYLIDKKDKPMGGAFYPALLKLGLEDLLKPVEDVLSRPLGSTTVGEVIRVFRNKAVVHPSFRDADLDRVYAAVDMESPDNQARLRDALVEICLESARLAINLADRAGIPRRILGLGDD